MAVACSSKRMWQDTQPPRLCPDPDDSIHYSPSPRIRNLHGLPVNLMHTAGMIVSVVPSRKGRIEGGKGDGAGISPGLRQADLAAGSLQRSPRMRIHLHVSAGYPSLLVGMLGAAGAVPLRRWGCAARTPPRLVWIRPKICNTTHRRPYKMLQWRESSVTRACTSLYYSPPPHTDTHKRHPFPTHGHSLTAPISSTSHTSHNPMHRPPPTTASTPGCTLFTVLSPPPYLYVPPRVSCEVFLAPPQNRPYVCSAEVRPLTEWSHIHLSARADGWDPDDVHRSNICLLTIRRLAGSELHVVELGTTDSEISAANSSTSVWDLSINDYGLWGLPACTVRQYKSLKKKKKIYIIPATSG